MTDKNISKQEQLVVTLEENAMDSLVHGIEHHLYGKRKSDWKYVILHVFHSVELFLKARLAKHDEKLIYKNRQNGYTVTCITAINRLINDVNIPLHSYVKHKEGNKYELSGELKELQQARNNIEHKEVSLDKEAVNRFLGVAFRFLDDFVSRELGLSLSEELDALDETRWEEITDMEEEVIEQNSYKTLSQAYLSYYKSMSDRGVSLHPKDLVDHSLFNCECCNEEAIIYPDPRSSSRITSCYNCRAMYEVSICLMCDQFYIEFLSEWEKGNNPPEHPSLESVSNKEDDMFFCDVCTEYISGK